MEKLNAPSHFVMASSAARAGQGDLMTPSHFTLFPKSVPSVAKPGLSANEGARASWAVPSPSAPVGTAHSNPWFAIAEAKQEILELRRENQRLMQLHGDITGAQNQSLHEVVTSTSRSGGKGNQLTTMYGETEWRLDTERLKAEVERLRGQLDALKEASGRQRDEIRERESTLSRQSYELQEARSELCRMKAELGQTGADLCHSRLEQERLCVKLEKLKKERQEEREKLEKEVERSRHEAHVLRTRIEQERQERDEAGKLEVLRLKEQLVEVQRKSQTELTELSATHQKEMSALQQACTDLQDKLGGSTQKVVQLEGSLQQAYDERDRLREELRKMESAFDTQSATLQSLRNYIGQLTPESHKEEELAHTVQKLEREKEALQATAELLTIRLNSLNDILLMQEKEMEEKILLDPLSKPSPACHKVLRCWREKVFTLLVQLRSKEIQLRGEKDKLVTTISTLEQEVKQQTYQTSVLQCSLEDKSAELDLERVGRQTLERELAQLRDENTMLKQVYHEAKSSLKTVVEDVKRFSHSFDANVTEVQAAQSHLLALGQRLTFANFRIDTIQGLIMRKVALWKVQQATKQAEVVPGRSSFSDLQEELAVTCTERDRLAQELKRTPSLIEEALAEAREQFESELRHLRQALQQSREEALELGRSCSQAEQKLQDAQQEVQEHTDSIAQLRAQLASQEEQSARALKERLSVAEAECTERLREMESQLNAARREHTKAVVTLRQSERQAEREREREKEIRALQDEQIKKEIQDLQRLLQETGRDRNLLLATVRENGLLKQYKKARTASLRSSAAVTEQQSGVSSGKTQVIGPGPKPPTKESLLSVLDDLQALSAAIVNSSDSSGDEDGSGAKACRHSEALSQRN
ncbi:coiled-coil alpha-helical rod protein 1 isoform X1 [Scleropages formosus]|nr:coiled-coil alpha-helical rod protein 1-like isoform X1 [Scleropages formosus]